MNGALFTLFSFLGQGINFVLLILLAKFIMPTEYGKLSLFSTVVTVAGFIMGFSTRGYAGITYFKKDAENFRLDFTATIILGIVSLVIMALPILFWGGILGEILNLSKNLLWFALSISFFSFTFYMQQDYLRIKEQVISYGLYNCGLALLNFLLTLLLVIVYSQDWMGRVNAWVIGTAIFGLLSFVFFYKKDLFRFNFKWKTYRDALSWGLPMMPHAASEWMRQGIDRYIINYFHSTYDVGIFSYAMNLGNIIQVIGMAFNSSNSVTLYQILSDESLSNQQKRFKLRRQTHIIFLIYLAATAIVLLSMSCLVYLALPKYINCVPFMWILAVSGFCKCIYFLYCNYLFYYGETKTLMYITFGTSLIHVALSLLLTRFSLYYTATIYGLIMFITVLLVKGKASKLISKNLK